MNKSYTTEVVIVGAGIAGLTLACLLEKHTAYRVIIVERGDAVRQRVSAVNPLSVKLWQHLGVWNESALQASPYRHMHVWDHCGAHIDFDASYLSDEPLGFITQDQRLHEALLEKLKKSTQVRLLTDQQCLEILHYDDHVCLQTQNTTLHAHYLIACDGAQSWVREKMQFAMTSWPYQHTAITAHITTEKPHRQTAWQKFTNEGPLAFLPLNDAHQCSIVWSVPPERADALLTLSDDAFLRELHWASEGVLGELMQPGQRFAFPLTMRHVKRYVKDRVILCADAAHTVHPLAGQGLNLAMQDVMSLLEVFMVSPHSEGISRGLRRYERTRKTENWQMILILGAIKRLYELKIPEVQMMVEKSVSVLNKIEPIKSQMLKLASGSYLYPAWLS
jgi:2-octaprenylphenol hydroxylase